jgi:hypothetical protein
MVLEHLYTIRETHCGKIYKYNHACVFDVLKIIHQINIY